VIALFQPDTSSRNGCCPDPTIIRKRLTSESARRFTHYASPGRTDAAIFKRQMHGWSPCSCNPIYLLLGNKDLIIYFNIFVGVSHIRARFVRWSPHFNTDKAPSRQIWVVRIVQNRLSELEVHATTESIFSLSKKWI